MSADERARLLDEASGLVNGARNGTYGEPVDDYTKVAGLWNAYIQGVVDRKTARGESGLLEPHDAIAMMVLLKVSRIANDAGHRDNWVDIAGYAACGWDATVDERARLRGVSPVDEVAALHARIVDIVGGYND